MKKILLLLIFAMTTLATGFAQDCMPAQNLPDSLVGVVPLPFDPETNPMGGINDTACVNEDFEFVFTLVIPEVFTLSGVSLPLNSIDLATEGAITNLPNGIDYACNPPNCVFPKDTSGCVVLYGVVNDTTGIYDLQIAGTVRTALFDLPLTFPNAAVFPGNYFLHVKPEGQCVSSSAGDLADLGVSTKVRPNPFSSFTQIVVNTPISGDFDLIVTNLLGRKVHRQRINLFEGENTIDFDGSQLASGIYIYTISNSERQLSNKMILNRN